MKRLSITIIGIFLLILFPIKVDAASLSVSLSCSNTTAGKSTTCTLRGNATDDGITGFEAYVNITNAAITSITPGGGFEAMPGNNNTYIAYYSGDSKVGSFTIATMTINTSSPGNANVSIPSITYVDSKGKTTSGATGTSRSFTISPAATQPPQTQAPRPTTKATTRATQAPTTAQPTAPVGTELKLDSVKVGDFEVNYQEGKYYVTVNYDTESVNVEATANPNLTLIGGGIRTLAVGKNVVEIIIRNEINQSATAQIIITRPEDTNDYSTNLSDLKLVDYDLKFNKDILEYTVYVPSNVKEVYVIAKSENVNVSIMGDGLQTLTNGNNDIHVKVQYGNKAETNYVIHIKRSYNSIIMWGVIAILSTLVIGTIFYFNDKLKKVRISNKEEKSKILAEANRTVAESKENVTLNGQSVVSPTSVSNIPVQNRVQVQAQPQRNIGQSSQNNNTQVVEKRVPTNPVTVATSTVSPTQVSPQAPTQVKLVQTLDRQPIKVNRTPVKTNGARQVVINTSKK